MAAKGKFRELVKLSKEGVACDQCNLGVAYALGDGTAKNLGKAVKWYRKAAEQGNVDAQFNAAVSYENGNGTAKDLDKAQYWYSLAAKQGDRDAKKKLKEQQVINAIRKYGFQHIVHWEVSETKDLDKALEKTKNGSILLFHSKKKDTLFLEKLIPALQEKGFEMVTVSELFGFDPPETSEELYVYNKENYRNKE